MSIRVSEKHGVNPSMPVCCYCGGDTGEIALLGRLPGDVEAPRKCIVSADPCDKCREDWKKGIALIEAVKFHGKFPPDDTVAITNTSAVTGRVLVVSTEFVQRVLSPGDLSEGIVKFGRALMEPTAFQMIVDGFDAMKARQSIENSQSGSLDQGLGSSAILKED